MLDSELERILRSRAGKFIPSHTRYLLGEDWTWTVGDIVLSTIRHDDEETRSVAREYMLENFFKEAVVPKALMLSGADDVVRKEFDMYLGSGSSIVARAEGSDEILGCYLTVCWPVDKDYDVVKGVSVDQWLRAAARVAMAQSSRRPEPVWRDLQYQCIYNVGQERAATHDCGFVMYYGMGHVQPEIRATGVVESYSIMLGKAAIEEYGMPLSCPTVNALRQRSLAGGRHMVEAGHIEYRDIGLKDARGRPVFRKAFKLGGISLHSADVTKFVELRKKMSKL